MNKLLRNSVAGDQSGIHLLPAVSVASPESAVISRSSLGCQRRGSAILTLRKNRQLAARKLRFRFSRALPKTAVFGFTSKTATSLLLTPHFTYRPVTFTGAYGAETVNVNEARPILSAQQRPEPGL